VIANLEDRMSCRHDFSIGTCKRCYPDTGTIDPGSEGDYEPNLEGPGAVTLAEYRASPRPDDEPEIPVESSYKPRLLVDGTDFELIRVENGEPLHFIVVDRRNRVIVEEAGRILEWGTEDEARAWCRANRGRAVVRTGDAED